jgi:hypothetical protein
MGKWWGSITVVERRRSTVREHTRTRLSFGVVGDRKICFICSNSPSRRTIMFLLVGIV